MRKSLTIMHFSIRFLVPLVFSYITFKSLLNSHIKLLFFTCCFTFCSDSAYCYSYSFKNLKKSILNLKSATFYAFCSLHFELILSAKTDAFQIRRENKLDKMDEFKFLNHFRLDNSRILSLRSLSS